MPVSRDAQNNAHTLTCSTSYHEQNHLILHIGHLQAEVDKCKLNPLVQTRWPSILPTILAMKVRCQLSGLTQLGVCRNVRRRDGKLCLRLVYGIELGCHTFSVWKTVGRMGEDGGGRKSSKCCERLQSLHKLQVNWGNFKKKSSWSRTVKPFIIQIGRNTNSASSERFRIVRFPPEPVFTGIEVSSLKSTMKWDAGNQDVN